MSTRTGRGLWAMAATLLVCAATPQQVVAEPAWRGAKDPTRVTATVRIVVTGLRNNKGTVYCRLYDRTADFPTSKPKGVRSAKARPAGGRATCVFRGIPHGRYAAAIAHDENGNRKIDRTLIGIPKEGYGFSAGAKPSLTGAPSFKQAAFAVRGDTRTTIRIINP